MGFCLTPSTDFGAGIFDASSTVGMTSMTCVNCVRMLPGSLMPLGQVITIGLRVPPKCEATCLTHCNGALPAQAQPTG